METAKPAEPVSFEKKIFSISIGQLIVYALMAGGALFNFWDMKADQKENKLTTDNKFALLTKDLDYLRNDFNNHVQKSEK